MKRNKSNKGYTVIEVLITIVGIGVVVGIGALVYAAIHFLAKIW